MGGRLIGELTGGSTPTTNLFLTDALGSVLTTFSNVQNSAAVQGNQVYGPYGTQQYSQGSMGTNKGYTGQYADPLTGFDYYNARYYDPVSGVFLSADCTQGNMQGMNPYAYVGANPETNNDPSGEMYAPPGGSGGNGLGNPSPTPAPSCNNLWCWAQQQYNTYVAPVVNHYLAPVEHFAQQVEETVIRTVTSHIPIIVPILISIAVAATIAGAGYAVWQLTHTDPNWTNVSKSENVTHSRWLWKKSPVPGVVPSTGHIVDEHVDIKNSDLRKRAETSKTHEASKFDSLELAQYAVDYALAHMTWAQKAQLLWMRTNPAGKFATLTLTGTADVALGYGFRYNTTTHKLTKYTDLTSYRVVIGIDFKTGQPFIITAYPTLPG
jgi:RHS repeat-associated protein